jgi:hypothetical protein
VTKLDTENPEYQVALFLSVAGPDALEIFNGLDLSEDEKKNLKVIIEKFDRFAVGETNEIYERYQFYTREHKDNENIETYIASLRILAQSCGFCECARSNLIRDRIVIGIRDNTVRKRLLREKKLTLTTCIEICKAAEATKDYAKQIDRPDLSQYAESETVNRLQNSFRKDTLDKKDEFMNRTMIKDCHFCGGSHERNKEKCPAYGQQCRKCGRNNHFSKACKSKKISPVHGVSTSFAQDGGDLQQASIDGKWVNSVQCTIAAVGEELSNEILAEMVVDKNETPVVFQVDSGATVNIIPVKYVDSSTLMKTNQVLKMWNKSSLIPLGTTKILIKNPANGNVYDVNFFVTSTDASLTPILGYKVAKQMGLITVNTNNFWHPKVHNVSELFSSTTADIFDEFDDVFNNEKIGCFPGPTVRLEIDEAVRPTVIPTRTVAIPLREKVNRELDQLVAKDVIVKVDKPTDWVSAIVIVNKKNTDEIRLCIDPKPLNKALKREHYKQETLEDILPELNGARVFSTLDLKSAFWHCELDYDSSMLTTFGTPFGRFRWKRLPFGLNVSSEIFEKKLYQALEGLRGVKMLRDDILVSGYGNTDEEAKKDHDRNMHELLKRCRQMNIKLNKDKAKIALPEVKFMGHILTKNGMKVDKERLQGIQDIPTPQDKAAVQRFIGIMNYISRFIPNLSDILKPLNELTHKDSMFLWDENMQQAFDKAKELAMDTKTLKFYDVSKPVIIQSDSSESGLGAVILQEGQPVAYASRALSNAETNYAQIEKEMLSVVYALQKFDYFVKGKKVTVQNDHKPLEIISKKTLDKAPKRLQKMLLAAQQYEYEIIYKPGKEMYLPDTLSRAYAVNKNQKSQPFEFVLAMESLSIRPNRLEELRRSTDEDKTMQELKYRILNGWPDKKEDLPEEIRGYHTIRDELTTLNGLLFKGERILVPYTQRKILKEKLHESHMGVESCLNKARLSLYWPGMTSEIKDYISSCEICLKNSSTQQKEEIIQHDFGSYPWQFVGVDFLKFDSANFVIIVDYYSNFIEVEKVENLTAYQVIGKLKSQFARHGIPEKLFSDGGPPFNSVEFREFCSVWEIKHELSSPTHAKSNGKAESGVKTIKNLFKKAKLSNTDVYLCVLDQRNTPQKDMKYSPSQMLMSRHGRTLIPLNESLMAPKSISSEEMKKRIETKQLKQKIYYNKNSKNLQELKPKDIVFVQPRDLKRELWKKAVVQEKINNRRYKIRMNDKFYIRNRVYLRLAGAKPMPDENDFDELEDFPANDQAVDVQSDDSSRTRYGRVIKQPDRFGYK